MGKELSAMLLAMMAGLETLPPTRDRRFEKAKAWMSFAKKHEDSGDTAKASYWYGRVASLGLSKQQLEVVE